MLVSSKLTREGEHLTAYTDIDARSQLAVIHPETEAEKNKFKFTDGELKVETACCGTTSNNNKDNKDNNNKTYLKKVALLAVVTIVLMATSIAGLTFAVVEFAKDIAPREDGTLVVKANGMPVRTENTDFFTDANGVLVTNKTTNATTTSVTWWEVNGTNANNNTNYPTWYNYTDYDYTDFNNTDYNSTNYTQTWWDWDVNGTAPTPVGTSTVVKRFERQIADLLDMPLSETAALQSLTWDAFGGKHEYRVTGASHFEFESDDESKPGIVKRVCLLKFQDMSGLLIFNDYDVKTSMAVNKSAAEARFLPKQSDVYDAQDALMEAATTLDNLSSFNDTALTTTSAPPQAGVPARRKLLWFWETAAALGRIIRAVTHVVVEVIVQVVIPVVAEVIEEVTGNKKWGEDFKNAATYWARFLAGLTNMIVNSRTGEYFPESVVEPPVGRVRDLVHVALHMAFNMYGGFKEASVGIPPKASELKALKHWLTDEFNERDCGVNDWGFPVTTDNFVYDKATGGASMVTTSSKTGDVAVVLMGTHELDDWKYNFDVVQAPCTIGNGQVSCGRVHRGFQEQYATFRDAMKTKVLAAAQASEAALGLDGDWSILVTGHSLGGATSQLATLDLASDPAFSRYKSKIVSIALGAPAVGDAGWMAAMKTIQPTNRLLISTYLDAPTWMMPEKAGMITAVTEAVVSALSEQNNYYHTHDMWLVPCLNAEPGDDDSAPTNDKEPLGPGLMCHAMQFYWHGVMQHGVMQQSPGPRYSDSECTCREFNMFFRAEAMGAGIQQDWWRNWDADARVPNGCKVPGDYYPMARHTLYTGGQLTFGIDSILGARQMHSKNMRYQLEVGVLGALVLKDTENADRVVYRSSTPVCAGAMRYIVNDKGQLAMDCWGDEKWTIGDECESGIAALSILDNGALELRCGGTQGRVTWSTHPDTQG